MIATMPPWPEDDVIETGAWHIVSVHDDSRDLEFFNKPIPELKQRNGFRSPPVNPAKRIKSKKKRRK